ncbi:MAG: cation:proton antiporter [Planctomycetota bacterium]
MLTDVALLVLCALVGNLAFGRLGLPGILGMIAAGVLLGPAGLDVIEPGILAFLKEAKTAALLVILVRAGLGISRSTLHRIGGPAIRMSFVPGLLEGSVVTAAAYLLLDLPFLESGMLGFLVAAVSPAVVVPTMLELKERGFGERREVPTLVLAGASVDDVVAITAFGVFAGLASGGDAGFAHLALAVPGGVLLGAAIGAGLGFLLLALYRAFPMKDATRALLLMIVAVVFYDLAELPAMKEVVPIAALLGIMAIGFVVLERDSELAHDLGRSYGSVWVLAELLLFVYIGTEVKLDVLDASLVGIGLVILAVGLAARSIGVWLALLGSDLSTRERLFCVIAYWPKATVQAAMGAVPLSMVLDGRTNSMTEASGETILAVAVFAIVVTAPLGAIGIQLAGPRLLTRG